MRSVPSSKISTTDDSPSTDLERSVFSPGTPFIAASSGTLTSASTSAVDKPGASVWISTSGGANSGKTSNGASRAVRMPTTMSTTDNATTGTRSRNAEAMSPRIMAATPAPRGASGSLAGTELGTEELGRPHRDHLSAWCRTLIEDGDRVDDIHTDTRRRTYTRGAPASYTHVPPYASWRSAARGTTSVASSPRSVSRTPTRWPGRKDSRWFASAKYKSTAAVEASAEGGAATGWTAFLPPSRPLRG